MDYSLRSILNDTIAKRQKVSGRYRILVAGLVLIAFIGITPTGAENSPTITLNPIGNYTSGEMINITGTSTINTCKLIGIEILPKSYWNSVGTYAKEDSSGKVVFNLIPSSSENFDPSGIKLVRFNLDKTQSSQTMDLPKDHILITVPVEKTVLTLKHWSICIEKNDNGTSLSPGIYHVNIWDATNQKQDYDNPMPNGWDISHQKIYPSTGRINLWDAANQKDMQYAEFVIR
ncbi:MAG: hypothetical protein CVV33_09405 [Methanomicrobiales archaeon HGW-Methanomicrobiales-4]|nr:MAG: hypothetical protein CVV33_09405 [Methanomicrobiales archaeon HGW-Methanomicrobiales-4]